MTTVVAAAQSRLPSAARRFVAGFVPTFIVAIAYWLIVLWQAPSFEAARFTLLSNVALSVFYPIVIPFIAGALTSSVRPYELIGRTRPAKAVLALVAVFALGSAVYILVGDSGQALNDRVIEPIEFRGPDVRQRFFDLNDRLRRAGASPAALGCGPSSSASDCYIAATRRQFGEGVRITLREHMGIASWWQRVMSAQALLVAVALFVSLIAFHLRGRRDDRLLDSLLVCLGLAILWIPFRVYSDWYIHYRSFATLSQYWTFGIGSVVALMALLATYFRRTIGEPSKVFSVVAGATASIASVVAAFKPELLGPIANFVGSLPIGFVIVFEVAVLLLLYVMVGPPLEGGEPSD